MSEHNDSRSIAFFLNGNLDGILGQYLLAELWPLDKAEGSAIEIILKTHVIHFVYLLDTIEIKVIDEFACVSGAIFIDDGEGGRRDDIVNA